MKAPSWFELANRIWESDLSPIDTLVMLLLVTHLPNIEPSRSRIVNRTRLSERAVTYALQRLEETGWLVVDRQNGRRSGYKLGRQFNQCTTCTSAGGAPVQEVHPTSAGAAPLPVHQVHTKRRTKEEEEKKIPHVASASSAVASAEPSPTRIRKPERKRKAKAKKATDPNHTPLVAFYFAEFERVRRVKPLFSGRSGNSVSKLLKAVRGDLELAKRVITNALTAFGSTHTIDTIANDPSRWLAAPPPNTRKAGPAQPNNGERLEYDTNSNLWDEPQPGQPVKPALAVVR